MKLKALIASVALVICASSPVSAVSARVVDGDTIEISGIRYRLHGIDAPEAGQSCAKKGGGNWPCGREAISAMEDIVSAGTVTCEDRGQDGYGRTIGICRVGGLDINKSMVERGLAWAFVKYSRDYEGEETVARNQRKGVWQADTETPWDFRSHKWDVAKQDSPDNCPIKGNISKQGMVYHAPWSPWYTKTKVSLKDGERWFCSEDEAVKAGWRVPIWGH